MGGQTRRGGRRYLSCTPEVEQSCLVLRDDPLYDLCQVAFEPLGVAACAGGERRGARRGGRVVLLMSWGGRQVEQGGEERVEQVEDIDTRVERALPRLTLSVKGS